MEAGDPRANAQTIADVLRRRAALHPGRTAYRFVSSGSASQGLTREAAWTFAELSRRADEIGAGMAKRLEGAGAAPRVLLMLDSGLDFVAGLFACFASGAIAVPVPAPHPSGVRESELDRLKSVAKNAEPSMVLTTPDRVAVGAKLGPSSLVVTTAEELTELGRGADAAHLVSAAIAADANAPALLQYTSGSTGTAKGVLVGHRNLLYTSADINAGWKHSSDSAMVSWLPPFHDMGLVYGLLQPVYSGFQCVLMPTVDFVRDPIHWLALMSRYGATHAAAPNFGYELCVRRFKPERADELDLSRWRVALDSAETVRPETIDRFTKTFEPFGFERATFCPGYGLAEATVKVTAVRRGVEPGDMRVATEPLESGKVVPTADEAGRRIASCGSVELDTTVQIVDPESLKPLPAQRIGEIWVQGPNISIEYWRRPDESQATFHAHLADGSGPWMRTGDLGFVDERGELYFTARLSDRIVVRGRNLDPDAVETICETACPELRKGRVAAFSIEESGGEGLGIAAEVVDASTDADDVLSKLRRALGDAISIDPARVVLVESGRLPRTSSGKLRRRACADRLNELERESLGAWRADGGSVERSTKAAPARSKRSSADTAEARALEAIADCVARLARVELGPADLDRAFAELGLDSLKAVELVSELSARSGVELPTQAAYDYPTPRTMARALAERATRIKAGVRRGGAIRKQGDVELGITGLACRFPQAPDAESFWELISSGRSGLTEPPPGRWEGFDLDALPVAARTGGFLDDIERFDAGFFGISEREASRMDPQHRVLIETVWHAVENAGLTQAELSGSQTGVFVGLSTGDHSRSVVTDLDRIDVQAATGVSPALAANRISYLLDLRGPSYTVDAACASSLIALHAARQAILNGECDRAIVAGVHLMPTPHWSVAFANAGMLSPSGRCLGFDAAADGYVRAEGCGAIVLERSDLAKARRRRPLALVLGSAIGQDGRTNGITAPSSAGQATVVRTALADAGVEPGDLGYVEAHGTGTPIGDPIELAGLEEVFGPADGETPAQRPRLVSGSVKSNIGHTEAAAGIAGLIKVILGFEHEGIAPHRWVDGLAPKAQRLALEIDLPPKLREWSRGEERRIAGISSFGFGGANAHVVLSEPPLPEPVSPTAGDDEMQILVLSARTRPALQQLAEATAHALATSPARLVDLAYTSRAARTPNAERLAVIGADRATIGAGLLAFSKGEIEGPLVGSPQELSRDAAELVERFVAGGAAGELPTDAAVGARRVDLPGYPFEGRPAHAATDKPASEAAADAQTPRGATLAAIAAVAECEVAELAEEQSLYFDLGFDSLMVVELNRALMKVLPALGDKEKLFTEEATIAEVIAIAEAAAEERGMVTEDGASSAATPMTQSPGGDAAGPRRWDTYADLIGVDPEKTYVGGAFKSETHKIHTLAGEGDTLTGHLDVENVYSGGAQFHLTQMAAYAFLVQMVHGYLCYKHGVGKDGLGMPKLVRLDMDWAQLVRTSTNVPGKVKELSSRVEDGITFIEIEFDLGEGGVTGSLLGKIPIEPEPRPIETRTREEFATLAELYRKDPKDTYTGGTFSNEKQRIRDIVVDGMAIKAEIDVLNEYSGKQQFHLSQMGSYSCMVQLLLGYLCAKHNVSKDKLGMPVLHKYAVEWREMVPFDEGITFELEEVSCEEERGRYRMEFAFTVAGDHGKGRIKGMVPKPKV